MTAPRRRPFNQRNIGQNLGEAIDELQSLLEEANSGKLTEGRLQVGLLHAYHHLNFAWNTRRVSTSEYSQQAREQFERWGKYPLEIEEL